MRSVRNALATAAVWLIPSLAIAQPTKQAPSVPALGAPGAVILGVVLGAVGLVMHRRRPK